MEIRQGRPDDLPEILDLIQAVIQRLNAQNIDQWGDFYPTPEIIANDLQENHLFVATQDDRIAGIMVLNDLQSPEYFDLVWQFVHAKSMVVHRLALHPDFQKRGIATAMMKYAEQWGLEHDFGSIRLDAYSLNKASLNLYEKLGYQVVGQVRFPHRSQHFCCYEKLIHSCYS